VGRRTLLGINKGVARMAGCGYVFHVDANSVGRDGGQLGTTGMWCEFSHGATRRVKENGGRIY